MLDRIRRIPALMKNCARMIVLSTVCQRALVSFVVASLIVGPVNAQQRLKFDIDAGPASRALNTYAYQADAQVGFTAELVQGSRTNAVKGVYEPMEALRLLLEGTGLTAQQTDKGLIIHNTKTAKSNPYQKSQATTSAEPTPSSNGDSQAPVGRLEEIIVTGSQIRKADPVGANVIILDREQIRSTGLPTTQQILQSVPQNFGGGANEDTQTVGVGPITGNRAFSSSVNLRGLGTESTLLLVNGRRSAHGGAEGSFVDLNSIPTAAIERVEILPDGASAIYGSDAIGGVVNVILRDDYDGAETRVRYAPSSSEIDELQLSHVVGRRWTRGNALLTFEYYDRSALRSEDRIYTRDSDLRNLGGENFSRPFSNPGNIVRYTLADGTQQTVLFPIPENQDGTGLTPDVLQTGPPNLQNIREGTTVLPDQQRSTVSLLGSWGLTSRTNLFGELRYSSRKYENRNNLLATTRVDVPSSNPFFVDPFGGATELRIEYAFVDDYGAQRSTGRVDTVGSTLGATFDIGGSWRVEGYAAYNSEEQDGRDDRTVNTALLSVAVADPDPNTAFNPFAEGSHTNPATLSLIEGYSTANRESRLAMLNVIADGDLLELSGGAIKLAVGAQFRDESLTQQRINFTSTLEPVVSSTNYDLGRDVAAAFAELYVPLVSEVNDIPGIRSLAVSFATRFEEYSDAGSTTNPKIGLSWSPIGGLTLRTTAGTSFRAPLLTELDDSLRLFQTFAGVPDPASPTGETTAIFRLGNSPRLKPEEGETWTAGFDIGAASGAGLYLGVTYFSTMIDNLIQVPTQSFVQPLLDPDAFAPIIQRVPGDVEVAAVAEILNEPFCIGCSSFSAEEIGAIIDFRLNNLNKLDIDGVDVSVAYGFEGAIGSFDLSLHASHLLHFKEQAFASGPLEDQVDTFTKPNSLQIRSSFSWSYGPLRAAIFGNHIGDYTSASGNSCQARPAGFCDVGSWTTWDLNVGYDFSDTSRWLEGTKLSMSVLNVLDEDPPFVQVAGVGVGFDPFNANPLGRFIAVELARVW